MLYIILKSFLGYSVEDEYENKNRRGENGFGSFWIIIGIIGKI